MTKTINETCGSCCVGVVCMPGGSGKTTFCQKYSDMFDDIDDIWDATATEETLMTRKWKDAIDRNDDTTRKQLEAECILYKATKYRTRAIASEVKKIVLCQSFEQAMVLLGSNCHNGNNNDEVVGGDHVRRLLYLVPTEELHRQNLKQRGDDQRIIDICWDQRNQLLSSRRDSNIVLRQYEDFDEMESILLKFAKSLGARLR